MKERSSAAPDYSNRSLTDRARYAITLGLPVVGGMISQNVLNLVDTGMVGVLGDQALAGVGAGSFIVFMSVALVMGLSAAVQAYVARLYGAGETDNLASALHGALCLGLLGGALITLLVWFGIPHAFPIVNADPEVIAVGVPYIRWRIISAIAVAIHFSFRGFWNAINRPSLYFRTLVFMHTCNIFLNYCLIFGEFGFPEMGTDGAALGTAISLWLGVFYYFYLGMRHARVFGFLRKSNQPMPIMSLLRMAIPNGLQQFLFATGLVVLFTIIGLVGTAQAAAANVLINIMLVAILPAIAFGLVAASLVGQALGRENTEDAARWGWDIMRLTFVFLLVVGGTMVLFPERILGLFLREASTLEHARVPLQIFGASVCLDGAGLALMQALLGAGYAKRVMMVSVSLQWFIFLPVAYWVGPVLGYGLTGIWIMQATYRTLQTGAFAVIWKRRRWIAVKL